MNSLEMITTWLMSDTDNNVPVYFSLFKEQIIKNGGELNPNNVSWMIEDDGIRIFIMDDCYRKDYPHSMETLILISGNTLLPNKMYFNMHEQSPYTKTIFNWSWVMSRVRNDKLNTILT